MDYISYNESFKVAFSLMREEIGQKTLARVRDRVEGYLLFNGERGWVISPAMAYTKHLLDEVNQ